MARDVDPQWQLAIHIIHSAMRDSKIADSSYRRNAGRIELIGKQLNNTGIAAAYNLNRMGLPAASCIRERTPRQV